MKVWFHSTFEQEPDDDGTFSYDTITDSKLFASLTACSQDAEAIYQDELEMAAQRYSDAMSRYEIAQRAMKALDEAGIDVSTLYWSNYAENPPKFHAPKERYIYSLDVAE